MVNGQVAVAHVLSALGATTAAGNFAFTYTLNGTGPTNPPPTTTTTTQTCPTMPPPTVVPSGAGGTGVSSQGSITCSQFSVGSAVSNTPVTGGGTIDVNPTAMVTTANVGGGLNVVVRVDNTDYWEESGGTTAATLSPPSNDGPGSPLSGFAGLVDSTLGNREGGVAMLGMASPSGYLDLDQQQVTSAGEVGTGTVGGAPVTIYEVHVSPAQEAQVTGASTEEMKTITNALATLQTEGYTGTTIRLSIDGQGYIREADSTANFADGGTAVLDVTLSNFGCAGTVLTPGQQGSGLPPANCTSPVPSIATTTTTTAPAHSSAVTAPTTSTTVSSVPPTTSITSTPTTSTTTTPTTVPSTLVVPPNSTVPGSPPPSG